MTHNERSTNRDATALPLPARFLEQRPTAQRSIGRMPPIRSARSAKRSRSEATWGIE